MNIYLYTLIFFSKIIENGLSTLRLIVVANGKKGLGAILQFFITIVWAIVTGSVVHNINKKPLTIVFFALGSYIGSYIGSFMEEKIALGNSTLIVTVNKNDSYKLTNELKNNNLLITQLKNKDNFQTTFMITILRKEQSKIIKIINDLSPDAPIINQKTKVIEIE